VSGEDRRPDDPWPVWPEGFATAPEDVDALLVLCSLRSITPRRLIEVAVACGTATATLDRIRAGGAGSENDRRYARALRAERIASDAHDCGARFVAWGSAEYPRQLRSIADPPAGLFVRGAPLPDPTRAVAVVGARRCSELGRELAADIGRALGLAGTWVVSGAARGIDTASHEGALSARAATAAVLGFGLDLSYPPGSRGLFARIVEHGGSVLSEYPPGVPPDPRNFPARNRIVAGLCRATVVVEGADGSGSMITAEHALEFGRDVYAVPGAVTSPLSAVPLRLIREGATMIRSGQDLLHDLGLGWMQEGTALREDLPEPERAVLDRLVGPTLPDRLASELGTSVAEVVGVLMQLELRGLVRSLGGRYESTLAAVRQAEARSSRRARGTPEDDTSRTGTPARSSRLAAIEER
jgi:DNA processing protein